MNVVARWRSVASLVAAQRDVLDARPGADDARPAAVAAAADGSDVPGALVARGWASFLLALSDDELDALEIAGHDATWPRGAPPSLVALTHAARDVCALPMIVGEALAGEVLAPARRLETPRKRAQIEAFARIIVPLAAHAERVVDVGSGHGHLTRDIAERIARPVIGLERDDALTQRARSLPSTASPSPSFAVTDVLREGLSLGARDCVIGLHACGELGDAMVESAARSGAALALVGCCLQKRRADERAPLSRDARAEGAEGNQRVARALHLPRSLLGLSNLTARDEGVEATRAENLAGRERRLALHRLLTADGAVVRFGAEIDGLNRRAAQRDLASLVARAFAIRRRPPPSASAIAEAATWASAQHARVRRLSLPRALLARVLEVLVLVDRARCLEERGRDVTIGLLFPARVSARNLVLVSPAGAPSRDV